MPDQNLSSSTSTVSAHFAGFVSPLADALKQALENLHINVFHSLPAGISPTYCFYFLPQTLATPESSSKIRTDLDQLLDRLGNEVKFCLIMHHPDEYYFTHHPTLFPHFNTQEKQVLTHQNHLLSCVDYVKQKSTTNSRIIVVKDCLGGNIGQDAPLLIEAPFIFLPAPVNFLNQSPIVSPVSYHDVAKTIIKTVFSQHSRHQIYLLEGSQPLSLNVLNQQIQANVQSSGSPVIISLQTQKFNLPATKISIKNSQPLKEIIDQTASAVLNSKTHSPSFGGLPQASSGLLPTPFPSPRMIKKATTSPSNIPANSSPKKNWSFRQLLKTPSPGISAKTNYFQTGVILSTIFLVLIIVFGIPLIYLYLVSQSYQAIKQSNISKAGGFARVALSIFPIAQKTTIVYLPLLQVVGGHITAGQITSLLTNINGLVAKASELPDVISTGNQLVAKMVAGEKGDTLKPLSAINIYSQKAYETISSFEAFLSGINQSELKPYSQIPLQKTLSSVRQGRGDLKNITAFLGISPQFTGSSEPKTYLLLLQNNHELRATGGFIGSFALVTFDQGKLIDIETHDVYAADGQLRGHVEPPAALKKHLGEANWYLRDSNWDPNFPTTARRAEWFLSKEMNRQVDGTIAIDLYTVQKLLTIIGEIQLPDYGETITADNLFARAEYHSEINFFAGSTQKKDFLSALMNAVYVKIAHPQETQGISIMKVFLDSAKEAHLQISVRDEGTEDILSNTIFSGRVVEPSCPQVDQNQCLVDYLGVVDSNVGVNKVNYFINRRISHQININGSQIDTTTKVVWDNTAQSSAWPAGSYKNYVRLVVPQYASVVSLMVGDKAVSAKDIDIEVRHEKKYIGTYLEVPLTSQQSLELTTQYTVNPDLQNGYFLTSYIEKQAGTYQDPFQITIKNQSNFKLFKTGNAAPSDQIVENTTLTTDQMVNVELRP